MNTDFIVDLAGVAATEGFTAEEGVVNGTINVAEGDSIDGADLKNLTGATIRAKPARSPSSSPRRLSQARAR